MKNLTFYFLMLLATMGFAQNAPITFEPGGQGANWTWAVFENATNPPLEIIANPDPSGINTSATVAKFTALAAGNPWAGCESMHGADLGPFVLGPSNSIIKIMVWKSVISDVGIKLASPTGWAQVEIKRPNTLVNQWEELTFDFSNYLNPPADQGQLDQVIVFPDFNLAGRGQDNIIYFDNITFSAGGGGTSGPATPAPTPPARDAANVVSVFSGAYAQVPGTDFNPNWGQSTVVATIDIQGNPTLRYANFNYQGTQFAQPLNVSAMEKLHVDMWTANATSVNIFCISPGPVETAFALPVTPGQWVSYDIPLTAFANVDLTNVIQFKFDGGDGTPTIYLDNLYFYKEGSTGGTDPNAPINFEPGGFGADWTWTVFENATNPPLQIIANPDPSGINTSATVAKFTALQSGNPWAGVESMHGADLGPFVLGPSNSTVKIMVWKSVISDVGIKFASTLGWAQVEIKRPNTVINQWEELTFDFSSYLNPPADQGPLDQIIIFPDFNLSGRTQDNIIYFDNITFGPSGGNPTSPLEPAPTPTRPASSVISLFSNAYTNVPVDTWRTDWSNAILEDIAIQGNATKKYSQLDFVGIETVANQIDATGMTHFHIDVWSANFTFFGVKLVDFGADGAFGGGDDVEHQINYNLPQQGQWLSLDIPLSSFTGLTTRAHMAQYILVGQPSGANTIFVDNVYFYTNIVDTDEADALRNTVRVYPNPVVSGERIQFNREVAHIEVFDLTGKRIAEGSGYTLNTAVLKSGVYVLRMRTQDGYIQTQKLVVK